MNEKVAAWLTGGFMTMECTYLFFLWALLPLWKPEWEGPVQYISQGVIQLVALPLILVGTAVMSRAAEDRAKADHQAIMAEFAMLKQIIATQQEELKILRGLAE